TPADARRAAKRPPASTAASAAPPTPPTESAPTVVETSSAPPTPQLVSEEPPESEPVVSQPIDAHEIATVAEKEPPAEASVEPPIQVKPAPIEDKPAPIETKPVETKPVATPPRVAPIRPTGVPPTPNETIFTPIPEPRQRGRRTLEVILWALAAILLIVAVAIFVPILFPNLLPSLGIGEQPLTAPTIVAIQPTAQPSPTTTQLPTQAATEASPAPTQAPLVIPTPPLDGEQLSLLPNPNLSGWYESDEAEPHYGDANLHAGSYQGKNFGSIIQFNLRNYPTDSKILFAALELTGRDATRLGASGDWQLDILENSPTTDWANVTPEQLAQVPSLMTVSETLTTSDLAIGHINRFVFDDSARQLLEQQFKNGNLVFRLRGPAADSDNLFTWESGAGASALAAPTLHLVVIPGHYVVVTNTPVPQNVLTAAAYVVRGTEQAKRNGTPTTFPPGVATATPGGEIVEVAAETAVPGNQETAIARAVLATAIARTTGTYTPNPQNEVIIFPTATPFIIAPENLATATPIPPDADLLTIPIDYEHCHCQGMIAALTNQFGGQKPAPFLLSPTGQVAGMFHDDLIYRQALVREQYSPDRKRRVVYPQDSARVQQIGIEDVDTGDITFLTRFPRGVAYDAAWAPDNSGIVFVATVEANADQIYFYDFGTQQLKLLIKTPGGQPWFKHPTWSPDSKQIAYWSSLSGHKQIWVMNSDGTNQHNISNNEFDETDPVWLK
ncbi:MAG TPA: hypothetical protein VFD70_14025, partial [Anaerolineae bacterium]|nr:hypothetical protein [Anaerolineae bacterium]